ncbi:hypothetical protein CW751_02890 [Brumimicrobium salinarum]|uniref:Uncharacterized protein n=1 Tax=Brumimicrobium salinarum TaxID=2058658 RepID=A0A2I0R6U9_9FLAO|nr:hypothetical protein [Brumimicrobium salinarum]PKR82294.1 hypothetical protein CW751_02890 [Brumimicrobium salinarum]
MKTTLLFTTLLFVHFFVSSQKTTVQVLDVTSENPIAFAKVNDGKSLSLLTDIDGKATINIVKENMYSFRFLITTTPSFQVRN